MLTVTLVASMAAAALWEQWRSIEVETAERTRTQSLWILTGALDWARLILREDARSGGADHLGEPWSVPLAEARLSTFLAADKNNAPDSTDASNQVFLSGSISDLQARMNVLNLVDKESGKVSEPWMRAFARLFENLGLPAAELAALAENVRFAQDTATGNGSALLAPLLPQRTGQLRWLGLSARSVELLSAHITILPERTPVNLNTASATVLVACIATLDQAQAQRMVSSRQTGHFRTLADAGKVVAEVADEFKDGLHSVSSRYFEVRGRLRLEQTIVEERSVVQRDGLNVKTLWRDRAGVDRQAGTLQSGG
jgi:general secretion pathway protein K